MDTWAAGGDGVVVTAPERDRWVINVRGLDGEIVRVLQRDFTTRKRNDEDRAELTDGMVIIINGQRQEIESKTLEHDPAIMGLDVAADGRLFVTSCFDQRKLLQDGVAARYDVISPGGEFSRTVGRDRARFRRHPGRLVLHGRRGFPAHPQLRPGHRRR